jgi:pre-rRNA-processing protein IPI1
VLHQSISAAAPTISAQFSHHLALLNHKSDAQRRDSLAHLTSSLQASRYLPQPAATVLPKVQPLLLDSSSTVRTQCVKFLEAMPQADVCDNAEKLLLYARAALTHLSPRVRRTGIDVLEWLLNCAGLQVVSCAGGWTKTMSCLLAILGWSVPGDPKSDRGWTAVSQNGGVKSEEDTKTRIQQLNVLALLIETGLVDKKRRARRVEEVEAMSGDWPLWQWQQHKVPSRNNPYAHLNLFEEVGTEADDTCPDYDDRLRVFDQSAIEIRKGVENTKREGGGIGRAAVRLDKVMMSIYADISAI